MITTNNKNIKSILSISNNKEIIRITDTITEEIVWEKTVIPVEIDYLYIENTYSGTNTLTVKQTLTDSTDSSTYAKNIQFSKDKSNWTTITLSTDEYTISINQGEKVYFRGDEGVFNYWYSGGTKKAITTINCSQQYIIGGNINTLLDYNNPNSLTIPQGAFNSIFENDTNLTSASNLTLTPSVDGSLSTYVYTYMFRGCTGLTAAPKSIPATTQGNGSCYGMFRACSSLTEAPTLPATTLSTNCYTGMFYGCSSLKTAPALPATTLASRCYPDMFSGCTSLTEAPTLPASTLTDGCYWSMFRNCSSLTQAPEIQATTLAGNCCNSMFYGCVKLTKTPALLATTLSNYCYNQMFSGCTQLSEVTTFAEDISAVDCTKDWLSGVASSGTFYNNGSANFTVNSASGIPTGWTNVVPGVVEPDYFYIENLYEGENTITLISTKSGSPSTDLYSTSVEYSKDKTNWTKITLSTSTTNRITLNQNEKVYFRNDSGKWNYFKGTNMFYTSFNGTYDYGSGGDLRSILNYNNINNVVLTEGCFTHLFYYCKKLKTAPELPATTLAPYCYWNLFRGCSSLTEAPTLPATTLASRCYQGLFQGCTKLTTAPTLPATTLTDSCYQQMFYGCTALTSASELPSTNLADWCYYLMYYGCSSLKKAPTLPATTLAPYSYNQIFDGCSSLNEITTYADDISATKCTEDWLNGVASSGTFRNLGSATYSSGSSGIPSGWTVVTE